MIFPADELRPLWEHAKAAPSRFATPCQRAGLAGEHGHNVTQERIDQAIEPALLLAKESAGACYMMSNGEPNEIAEGEVRRPACYAQCHGLENDMIFGTDNFTVPLLSGDEFDRVLADPKVTNIVVEVSGETLTMIAQFKRVETHKLH